VQGSKAKLWAKVIVTLAKDDGVGDAPDPLETTVTVPRDLTRFLDQLVDRGDFPSREDAVIQLLWRGFGDYANQFAAKNPGRPVPPNLGVGCPNCGRPNEGTNACPHCGFLMMPGYCGVCGERVEGAGHLCFRCQQLAGEHPEVPLQDIHLYFEVLRKFVCNLKTKTENGPQAP
jgi:hypothetical protein